MTVNRPGSPPQDEPEVQSMQAYELAGPSLLQPIQVPAPDPQQLAPGEVLVRMVAGSVCGSDMPHFLRGAPVYGDPDARIGFSMHEIVADVVASASPDHQSGDRVVGWASASDGLAELVVTDGEGLFHCDPNVPAEETIIAQPLACVLFAVSRLPKVHGLDVAVIGLGPIGLLFATVLNGQGARSVTGVDPVDRSEVAGEFGVTHYAQMTSEQWANSLGPQDRPSMVIEAVGHQVDTLRNAIDGVAMEGTVYCFGIPEVEDYLISVTTLVRKNLTIIAGITNNRRAVLEEACQYLADRPTLARSLVTNVLPAAAAQQAYELASVPAPGRLKVVLSWPFGSSQQ